MNPEKVVFGFFIVLSLTLNFGFFIGEIDNPDHHHVYELFAVVVVNLIATILKFGDRSQMGALLLATSLVAILQLIAAAVVWTFAVHVVDSGLTPVVMIIEDPTIIAAMMMMPKVTRLATFSRVWIRPLRFSCRNPSVSSFRSALPSRLSKRLGISFCKLNNWATVKRRIVTLPVCRSVRSVACVSSIIFRSTPSTRSASAESALAVAIRLTSHSMGFRSRAKRAAVSLSRSRLVRMS